MDINIRKSVMDNLRNVGADGIRQTINDAITLGEDKVLPGLGVLFEVLWTKSDSETKDRIINDLESTLNH